MSYNTYFVIRQILMTLVLFMGCHMLFATISKQLHRTNYSRSMRIMGAAFCIVPLSCLLYTQENKLDLKPVIATAINLSAYYATFILMIVSFFILLGNQFNKKMRIIPFIVIIIYPTPLWISIFVGHAETISTVLSASSFYYLFTTVLLVLAVLYNHNKIASRIDENYTHGVHLSTSWISKSLIPLIGLTFTSLSAPFFLYCPRWGRFIGMMYGVLCFLHIYYGYRRIMINLSAHNLEQSLLASTSPREDEDSVLSPEVQQRIQHQLERWLSQKRYLQQRFTINDLAKEINTNRTYLSRYINSTYHTTFKSWVTSLRIEEAKQLLIGYPDTSINAVVQQVGFTSTESFTHIFTRIEGSPPAQWRDNYYKTTHNTHNKNIDHDTI